MPRIVIGGSCFWMFPSGSDRERLVGRFVHQNPKGDLPEAEGLAQAVHKVVRSKVTEFGTNANTSRRHAWRLAGSGLAVVGECGEAIARTTDAGAVFE